MSGAILAQAALMRAKGELRDAAPSASNNTNSNTTTGNKTSGVSSSSTYGSQQYTMRPLWEYPYDPATGAEQLAHAKMEIASLQAQLREREGHALLFQNILAARGDLLETIRSTVLHDSVLFGKDDVALREEYKERFRSVLDSEALKGLHNSGLELEYRTRIEQLETEVRRSQVNEQARRKAVASRDDRLASAEKDVAAAEDRHEQLRRNHAALQEQFNILRQNYRDANERHRENNRAVSLLENEVKSQQTLVESLQQQLEDAQTQLAGAQKALSAGGGIGGGSDAASRRGSVAATLQYTADNTASAKRLCDVIITAIQSASAVRTTTTSNSGSSGGAQNPLAASRMRLTAASQGPLLRSGGAGAAAVSTGATAGGGGPSAAASERGSAAAGGGAGGGAAAAAEHQTKASSSAAGGAGGGGGGGGLLNTAEELQHLLDVAAMSGCYAEPRVHRVMRDTLNRMRPFLERIAEPLMTLSLTANAASSSSSSSSSTPTVGGLLLDLHSLVLFAAESTSLQAEEGAKAAGAGRRAMTAQDRRAGVLLQHMRRAGDELSTLAGKLDPSLVAAASSAGGSGDPSTGALTNNTSFCNSGNSPSSVSFVGVARPASAALSPNHPTTSTAASASPEAVLVALRVAPDGLRAVADNLAACLRDQEMLDDDTDGTAGGSGGYAGVVGGTPSGGSADGGGGGGSTFVAAATAAGTLVEGAATALQQLIGHVNDVLAALAKHQAQSVGLLRRTSVVAKSDGAGSPNGNGRRRSLAASISSAASAGDFGGPSTNEWDALVSISRAVNAAKEKTAPNSHAVAATAAKLRELRGASSTVAATAGGRGGDTLRASQSSSQLRPSMSFLGKASTTAAANNNNNSFGQPPALGAALSSSSAWLPALPPAPQPASVGRAAAAALEDFVGSIAEDVDAVLMGLADAQDRGDAQDLTPSHVAQVEGLCHVVRGVMEMVRECGKTSVALHSDANSTWARCSEIRSAAVGGGPRRGSRHFGGGAGGSSVSDDGGLSDASAELITLDYHDQQQQQTTAAGAGAATAATTTTTFKDRMQNRQLKGGGNGGGGGCDAATGAQTEMGFMVDFIVSTVPPDVLLEAMLRFPLQGKEQDRNKSNALQGDEVEREEEDAAAVDISNRAYLASLLHALLNTFKGTGDSAGDDGGDDGGDVASTTTVTNTAAAGGSAGGGGKRAGGGRKLTASTAATAAAKTTTSTKTTSNGGAAGQKATGKASASNRASVAAVSTSKNSKNSGSGSGSSMPSPSGGGGGGMVGRAQSAASSLAASTTTNHTNKSTVSGAQGSRSMPRRPSSAQPMTDALESTLPGRSSDDLQPQQLGDDGDSDSRGETSEAAHTAAPPLSSFLHNSDDIDSYEHTDGAVHALLPRPQPPIKSGAITTDTTKKDHAVQCLLLKPSDYLLLEEQLRNLLRDCESERAARVAVDADVARLMASSKEAAERFASEKASLTAHWQHLYDAQKEEMALMQLDLDALIQQQQVIFEQNLLRAQQEQEQEQDDDDDGDSSGKKDPTPVDAAAVPLVRLRSTASRNSVFMITNPNNNNTNHSNSRKASGISWIAVESRDGSIVGSASGGAGGGGGSSASESRDETNDENENENGNQNENTAIWEAEVSRSSARPGDQHVRGYDHKEVQVDFPCWHQAPQQQLRPDRSVTAPAAGVAASDDMSLSASLVVIGSRSRPSSRPVSAAAARAAVVPSSSAGAAGQIMTTTATSTTATLPPDGGCSGGPHPTDEDLLRGVSPIRRRPEASAPTTTATAAWTSTSTTTATMRSLEPFSERNSNNKSNITINNVIQSQRPLTSSGGLGSSEREDALLGIAGGAVRVRSRPGSAATDRSGLAAAAGSGGGRSRVVYRIMDLGPTRVGGSAGGGAASSGGSPPRRGEAATSAALHNASAQDTTAGGPLPSNTTSATIVQSRPVSSKRAMVVAMLGMRPFGDDLSDSAAPTARGESADDAASPPVVYVDRPASPQRTPTELGLPLQQRPASAGRGPTPAVTTTPTATTSGTPAAAAANSTFLSRRLNFMRQQPDRMRELLERSREGNPRHMPGGGCAVVPELSAPAQASFNLSAGTRLAPI